MKNNQHIFAMSMGESNVSKLSQNLQILNFTEIYKNFNTIQKKIQKFSKMKINLIYAKNIHVLQYTSVMVHWWLLVGATMNYRSGIPIRTKNNYFWPLRKKKLIFYNRCEVTN